MDDNIVFKNLQYATQRIGILLLCMEHFLNPTMADESWDNPYSKDEAMRIIRDIYTHEGYNEEYIEQLFNQTARATDTRES